MSHNTALAHLLALEWKVRHELHEPTRKLDDIRVKGVVVDLPNVRLEPIFVHVAEQTFLGPDLFRHLVVAVVVR